MEGVWVWSLVKSHMAHGQKARTWTTEVKIVISSIKILKMVHIKKKKKKKTHHQKKKDETWKYILSEKSQSSKFS